MANPSSPLPNSIYRYIQQEETDGTAPFSENLLQGVGGNNNYLNKEANDILTTIANYSVGAVSIAEVFFADYLPPFGMQTPNGKPWYACFLFCEFNGNTVFDQARVCIPGFRSYFATPDTNPNVYVYISGNMVFGVNWGHEIGGFGLYQT